jgi:thiosulfate dehydrogenase
MRWFFLAVVCGAISCASDPELLSFEARGAEVANDRSVTRSQYNAYTCLTCHPVRAGGSLVLPGAALTGAARRPSYWGGEVVHLREAVERCWSSFMRGDIRDLDTRDGQALEAWLRSLSPATSTEGTTAVTMTFPRTVRDLGEGTDRVRGLAAWQRACARCHGAFETGAGRIGTGASVLPRETLAEHCDDELLPGFERQSYIRGTVVEKTRHGSFLGYAGVMPPFATEVLPDDDLRQIAGLFRCP